MTDVVALKFGKINFADLKKYLIFAKNNCSYNNCSYF